ncbi:S-layer homology domain-containing protein [Paenibacillus eucommiae]|uniref:SLH domain-containing protein n=1 Tax=Paenibacillus eucommiae TaxID=1355755 RepID=A0ABS4J0R6_9BACL|nr:S-layer homology domain-containing protein [Paenibacillus eucommiae]MBP1993423.1 hypothetical protein [Paenibacillus eucommiae]
MKKSLALYVMMCLGLTLLGDKTLAADSYALSPGQLASTAISQVSNQQFTGVAVMNDTGEHRRGVDVHIYRADPGSGAVEKKVLQLITDARGYFHIDNLADGSYQVRLSNDEVIGDYPYKLVIKNGKANETNVQFGLEQVQLIGRILHADGTPVKGAYVSYGEGGVGRFSADADENGTYRIPDLAEGKPNTIFFYTNETYAPNQLPSARWDFVYKGSRVEAPDAIVDGDKVELKARPQAVKFDDVRGHWAENVIQRAVEQKIAEGYPDNTFKPNRSITEAEFLTLLFKAFQVVLPEAGKGKHWSAGAYQLAYQRNYPVSLEADRKQDAPVSRSQVAEIIAGADGKALLSDKAIQYLLDKGYSTGKSAPTVAGYQGRDPLTRAEALQFIFNLKEHGMTELKTRPVS